jgi:hypothetical protein
MITTHGMHGGGGGGVDGWQRVDESCVYATGRYASRRGHDELRQGAARARARAKPRLTCRERVAHASGPCAGRARGRTPKARWAELEAAPGPSRNEQGMPGRAGEHGRRRGRPGRARGSPGTGVTPLVLL